MTVPLGSVLRFRVVVTFRYSGSFAASVAAVSEAAVSAACVSEAVVSFSVSAAFVPLSVTLSVSLASEALVSASVAFSEALV